MPTSGRRGGLYPERAAGRGGGAALHREPRRQGQRDALRGHRMWVYQQTCRPCLMMVGMDSTMLWEKSIVNRHLNKLSLLEIRTLHLIQQYLVCKYLLNRSSSEHLCRQLSWYQTETTYLMVYNNMQWTMTTWGTTWSPPVSSSRSVV